MLRKMLEATAEMVVRKMGAEVIRADHPLSTFHSHNHLRHTARRLEHLASLRLPVAGLSVLEVGAGIGDHSHYFLDRGCRVTITEARTENLAHIKAYYVGGDARLLDLEFPHRLEGAPFDLVHCYGLLYHLAKPKEALAYMSENATQMLFLETCVSFGEEDAINLTRELQQSVTQAYSGVGCRPTRPWLFRELRNLFEHVYVPTTQPWHEEFPLDWSAPQLHRNGLQRAVFICSRQPLHNDRLTSTLPARQVRHD